MPTKPPKTNTRRHNLDRPVRMTKRKPKGKKTNGVHPPNRGHGSQGHTREVAPSTDPMERAPSNRPFRDLASAALTANRGSGRISVRPSPLEAAKARRAKAQAEGTLPGGAPQQPVRGNIMGADEKLLLSDLASALREHTDTMREVNGLEPIDRSEEEPEFIPHEEGPGDEDADAPADETDAPADEDTDEPADETDEPAADTDEPADETDAPADETDAPADEPA